MHPKIGVSPRFVIEEGIHKQCVNTRYIERLTERGLNTLRKSSCRGYTDAL